MSVTHTSKIGREKELFPLGVSKNRYRRNTMRSTEPVSVVALRLKFLSVSRSEKTTTDSAALLEVQYGLALQESLL